MRVLMTGATGYLGSRVLKLLVDDPTIKSITVVSRSKKSHPDTKVVIVNADLSNPMALAGLSPCDFDQVVHLAGMYDLNTTFRDNYVHNILATGNLLSWLEQTSVFGKKKTPLIYASTYAVGEGIFPEALRETPIHNLPRKAHPYALTKAIAEQAVLASSMPTTVLRFGILIGCNEIDLPPKLDGPYPFLKFLEQVKQVRNFVRIRRLPVFADPDTILPLVPVDAAAHVVVRCLTRQAAVTKEIFGVYHAQSIRVADFLGHALEHFGVAMKPLYFSKIPLPLLKSQHRLTAVSAEAFLFASCGAKLENSCFEREFADARVSEFSTYQKDFFRAFTAMKKGRLAG